MIENLHFTPLHSRNDSHEYVFLNFWAYGTFMSNPNSLFHVLLLLVHFQGNVEIETYWLKGKRDKDGNAQAACPQFETQTISKAISKATVSGPEATVDEQGLVKNWN